MPKLGAHEIRQRFLDFFKAREHTVIKSSPLVPQNDPTLLFTNAGMVQFKDVFTGRDPRDYSRATSSQRCLRAGGKHNDLDNVGFTPRHHTFFEMLGNFSFGDYFKADAIKWAWAFLTEELGIPADKLVVSVFNGEGEAAPADDEAAKLWADIVPEDRIYRLNAKENFWAMGDTGPCGPCSEIHIYKGDGPAPGDAQRGPEFGPGAQDDLYTELWNLVFMQFEKKDDGQMVPLPRPSVDTGAGLERLAAVLAGVESNYETELLSPMVAKAKALAGVGPDGGEHGQAPFQVIADHARATAFLIADGVFPDKGKREYVLRRIMRRAIRFGANVGLDDLFFHQICHEVCDRFGDVYPELNEARATIEEVVKTEETAFRRTLDRGLRRVSGVIEKLDEGTQAFPVDEAALLYDTYGFPIDLTGVIAKEQGLTLDESAAEARVKELQAGGAGFAGGDAGVQDLYFEVEGKLDKQSFAFTGYDATRGKGTVWALVRDGAAVEKVQAGERVEVLASSTPFYAESGGQVGDVGEIRGPGGARVRVDDVQKPTGGVHVHRGEVVEGTLEVGAEIELLVDETNRDAIRRNHSATHLLHHALRDVLGEHVIQKGSLVAPDRLRFDFSHGKSLTVEEREAIEQRVNAEVLANEASGTRVMELDAAKAAGAIGLFGEKYDDEVRVVSIGRDSVELCGGTHVQRAGDIGSFVILSEGGIAQGVRRIEAVTGMGALAHAQKLARVAGAAAAELNAGGVDEIGDKLERLMAEHKRREKEIRELKRKLATGGAGGGDEAVEVEGIKLLTKNVGEADTKTLRAAADTLRDRLKSGVVILGAARGGKASLLVAVTADLTDRVNAGKLVGTLAAHVEGRGGGRPEMAQAGGPKAEGIADALAAAPAALSAQLAG